MQAGMTAKIAAADVDPVALQDTPVMQRRPSRRTLIFLLVGLLAYLLGLIITIPASVIFDENDRFKVGGTIWNGEAVMASTLRLEWSIAPLSTLANLGYTAQWRASGGGTDLAGDMIQHGDVLTLENVAGQIDGTLLAALAPDLPFTCDFTADLRLDRARLGGADQEVEARLASGPVSCAPQGMGALPVRFPALSGEATPSAQRTRGSVMTAQDKVSLMELRLSREGKLSVWPTGAAIRMAPFLAGKRYDTTID